MIVIDEKRIFDEIERRKPVSVALNGPDGILPKIQDTASAIMEKFGIPAYVLADSCFGTCDMNTNGAKVLGAEILFHIGHTVNSTSFGDNIVLIDAFDNISFDNIAKKCAEEFRGKTISLVTDSQHLHEVDKVKLILEQGGVQVKIGKGKGQLNDGQVFGCEFYPVMETREIVDANIFLGQSNFHAAGIALSTNKPT
ncbi:MAG TPA: diphthamide synthesis protein, partial [Candidatus Nitrosotalea sp.]|nr:diphthamide synthesis protein [Candidatus Nitrosotalea sp.]